MRNFNEFTGNLGLSEIIKQPPVPNISNSNSSAYAQTALANELAAIYKASNGARNDQVNKAAFALGQLVGGGELDRTTVEAALSSAGVSVGLSESETRSTISSGIEAGMQEPRATPNNPYPNQAKENTTHRSLSLDMFALNGSSQIMRSKMLDDVFVLQSLALLGQMTIFYSAPNVGKTLLTLWLIIEAIREGDICPTDLYYVNADDTYKGLVYKLELAETHGFKMLTPGHIGFKAPMLVDNLNNMVQTDTAKGKIIVLDTLKKFTDLMDKKKGSEFAEVVRQFISKGGTLIGLAHINKHRSDDGRPVYSGTTDLVDDGDCAYTIDVVNHASETKTIIFENFKARGDVAQEVTFSYETERGMTYQQRLESVQRLDDDQIKQAKAEQARQATYDRNLDAIRAIREVLQAGSCSKTDLVKTASQNSGVSKKLIIQALDDHAGNKSDENQFWTVDKEANNAAVYSLNEFL